MSLIVDVLKKAQEDAAAQRPSPLFVKYPRKKGLCLRAVMSSGSAYLHFTG